MKRITAIGRILNPLTNEIVIASNGMVSRETYAMRDRDLNFYMLGSMGMALGIGIGIAYAKPDLKVIVISGDGAVLMSLGTMVLHKKLGLKNLTHHILDNNCHATTGGQPTCSDAINFTKLAPNTKVWKVSGEIGESPRIPLTPVQIKERFMNAVKNISNK